MDEGWSQPRRIAFRFAFVAGFFFLWPFPLGIIPKTETLGEWAGKPWEWLVMWFGETVLGERPVMQETGSGDTLYAWTGMAVLLIVAAIGAAIWTALDRKRTAYPRLAEWSWVVLRYVLAWSMLGYGFAKVFPTQFQPPDPLQLDMSYGDKSPMGVLWTFMGASMPYTIFGGLGEVLGGALLLWRRTATLGALVSAAVLTNVVVLNFCYDVPVKLYSSQLLLMAIIIAGPQLKRVVAAVLGRAAPPVPERVRGSVRAERIRLGMKVAALALIAYVTVKGIIDARDYVAKPMGVAGTWLVDSYDVDGVRITDDARWERVMLSGRGRGAVRPVIGDAVRFGLEVDEAKRLATVSAGDTTDTWRYSMMSPHHLSIEGTFDGKRVRAAMHRAPPPFLETRGFHWVQEFPFNR
jgi:uncharacterized membrane protein YphA (DoxX/SURF4 family)